MENSGRALEIGAKIGTAAVNESSKAALSTIPDVITFYHTGKWLYLGRFQIFTFINVIYQVIPLCSIFVTVIEERSGKKIIDVNSFNISVNNIKEMITHFEDENKKSEKKIQNDSYNIQIIWYICYYCYNIYCQTICYTNWFISHTNINRCRMWIDN